jgi:phosphatidylinositol glycan class C protein
LGSVHPDPDNYTDQATFLEQLQRNPRLQPYLFWPLVADTTVIVQHVCSVILFVVSFVGIFQERVDHRDAVSFMSIMTFLGWLLWEKWAADEEVREDEQIATGNIAVIARSGSSRRAGNIRRRATLMQEARQIPGATPAPVPTNAKDGSTKENLNAVSHRLQQGTVPPPPPPQSTQTTPISPPSPSFHHLNVPGLSNINLGQGAPTPPEPSRSHRRLATVKSAALISSILLGLSPILKSLTRSTSSDSIWAMCFCLLAINIIFFDYSGDVGANFPASLSTNAALMASTVLASRLPETGQVFSLTVLSIEVFGLFPVFRRYARHRSWQYHVVLTTLLVFGAGAGVGLVVGEAGSPRTWWNAIFGMLLGAIVTALAMGGCSWWLIGLQKYKNEINGPWDAARPVIISRRYWDD